MSVRVELVRTTEVSVMGVGVDIGHIIKIIKIF